MSFNGFALTPGKKCVYKKQEYVILHIEWNSGNPLVTLKWDLIVPASEIDLLI